MRLVIHGGSGGKDGGEENNRGYEGELHSDRNLRARSL